jgi:PPK2 family polyphosphate:nucleotide phosphotransferase
MSGMTHAERYRVRPGAKVRLDEWDPADTSGFDGKESDSLKELTNLRTRLDQLQELMYAEAKHSLLVVLQGMDTSGKDGTIGKVFEGVNPSGVRVAHFRQPSPAEASHDFLWRVHPNAPVKGEFVIFNRSHYESVLVERVHGTVSAKKCHRRFKLINNFERLLHENDTAILKFYLNIDRNEQTKRLKERLADPTKHWKFSTVDLQERKLWPDYMRAYESAIENTSTDWAPWYVVPSNNKWFRNLIVVTAIVKVLGDMDMKYPLLPKGIKDIRIS